MTGNPTKARAINNVFKPSQAA